MNLKQREKNELCTWIDTTDSRTAAKNVRTLLEYVEYLEDRCEKVATLLRKEMVARVNAEMTIKQLLDGQVAK